MGQISGKNKKYKFRMIASNKDNDLREMKVLYRILIPRKIKTRKILIKNLLEIGVTIIVKPREYIIWISDDKVKSLTKMLDKLIIWL